ncbi:MAG: YicC/YloC family endoribonuclease [Thiobacillaceae bacterium]
MTGYAARLQDLGSAQATLELRSVNQRYLELSFRLPEELRQLEPPLREMISQRLSRGKVECRIALAAHAQTASDIGLNGTFLESLIQWQEQVKTRLPDAPPLTVADILHWPGLIANDKLTAIDWNPILLEAARQLLDEMVASRQREGDKLKQFILNRLTDCESQVAALSPQLPAIVAAYRDKLAARLAEALGQDSHERLAQELALFAQKVDVQEEISRLIAHFEEARRVLEKGGAVGKRLDFLMQELHREANTLGSKSVAVEMSATSLELKVLIEQMREQVQNIE